MTDKIAKDLKAALNEFKTKHFHARRLRPNRSRRPPGRVQVSDVPGIASLERGEWPSSTEHCSSTRKRFIMAKARAIIKRRKAVQNIRKITRTMELIATARFKKALDRATEAEALHPQDRRAGRRPGRDGARRDASVAGTPRPGQARPCSWCSPATGVWPAATTATSCGWRTAPIRSSRPQNDPGRPRGFRQAGNQLPQVPQDPDRGDVHASSRIDPSFDEVESSPTGTSRCIKAGEIDRLDVVYTQFVSSARQTGHGDDAPADRDCRHRRLGTSVRQAKAGPVPSTTVAAARGRAGALRVPARRPGHPRGDRPGLVQGPAVQVLPRRRRQRADRPDGGHARGDRRTPTTWSSR